MKFLRTTMGLAMGVAMLCLAMLSAPAHAASLGTIDVKSKLYEPFEARIAVRGVNDEELENLRVALADEATFERMGLPRTFLLTKFKFKVVPTGARRGYVQITTTERIREPSLTFVVEASLGASAGTLQRRYDVLLDLN